MPTSLLIHLSASCAIFVFLLGECLLARRQLSRRQSYALFAFDMLYNAAIYLALGSGIWLLASGPEPWLEALHNPWLLGKIALLVVIASFSPIPSWLIFSLREARLAQQPIGFSPQRLRGLRLLIGSELVLFAAIVWLSWQAPLLSA